MKVKVAQSCLTLRPHGLLESKDLSMWFFFPCEFGSPGLAPAPWKQPLRKDLLNPDNHNGVITHLEPDNMECKVKWALESITINKASGSDGIPAELFQILKDDAVKVLHSTCQQIWKTQ